MTHNDHWPSGLAHGIAQNVRRYRKRLNLSGEDLAALMTEAGVPMARPVLASFENGRRPTVSVAELLVLAHVLDVPPLALLLPAGTQGTTEVLPGVEVAIGDALAWVEGRRALPGDPPRTPPGHSTPPANGFDEAAGILDAIRWHDDDVAKLERAVRDWRHVMENGPDLGGEYYPRSSLAAAERIRDADLELVRQRREWFRSLKLTVPPIPDHLAILLGEA